MQALRLKLLEQASHVVTLRATLGIKNFKFRGWLVDAKGRRHVCGCFAPLDCERAVALKRSLYQLGFHGLKSRLQSIPSRAEGLGRIHRGGWAALWGQGDASKNIFETFC